jgi:4-aminobutyrate--pyruvate transaminase
MNFVPNSAHARDIANLIHPQTNLALHREQGPDLFTRGKGMWVEDDSGNTYLDSVSGLWCASLGLSVERLAKVAHDQMTTLGYFHTYRHSANEPNIDLAEKLLGIAPAAMSKALFQSSGSEANDTAIKLAWYYHNAIGKPEKRKIIGRRMAYHGSTAATISLSGKPDMHADFNLPFEMFRHTDFPHYYRFHEAGESEPAFATRMAESLEALILEEGPETVAAFFAEPVMGAAGAVVPPATYFEKVQAVLRKYEVLFVADEVICGFGRTGAMWGCDTYRIMPDMMTCAKALSAGMLPISAVLVSEKIYQAMLMESEKLGGFAHGFTHAGHPVTTAVALETLAIYEEMDVVGRARQLAPVLRETLGRFADHPLVGEVSCVGLIAGIELVRDKAGRRPFDPAVKISARLGKASKAHGLIHRAMGERVAFAPAMIATEEEITEIGARFGRALDDVWAEVRDL